MPVASTSSVPDFEILTQGRLRHRHRDTGLGRPTAAVAPTVGNTTPARCARVNAAC
jgi:hypothetical protein